MKCKFLLVIIVCICILYSPIVQAYEFINKNNEDAVKSYRDDIYLLHDTYKEFFEVENEEEVIYEPVSDNSNVYWWPIGSEETVRIGNAEYAIKDPEEIKITSEYGYRESPKTGEPELHNGVDLAPYRGLGVTNVIAAQSGTVVFSSADNGDNCPTVTEETINTEAGQCGGGYGNHVIIQHSDGNFTLYGHMYQNSITVKSGDTVGKGQVIGKVGSSGSSTGPHLHFEVRLAENVYNAGVNPLEFVSQENPRPQGISSNTNLESIKEFVETWEGTGCGDDYQTETEYIACYGYDYVITIGHGVVWEYNSDIFNKYGITSMQHGTHVSKEIVDSVEDEIFNNNLDSIRKSLANSGIDDLKDYQIAALLSRSYQGIAWVISNGNYPNFVDSYLKYGGKYSFDEVYSSTPNMWNDAMKKPNYTNTPGDSWGLYRRRLSEWKLFTTGEIDYYPLSDFDPYQYSW